MSIEYGVLPLSAEVFAWYAWNVCMALKRDVRQAYEWGHLGLLLCEKLKAFLKVSDRGRIFNHYYGNKALPLCPMYFC